MWMLLRAGTRRYQVLAQDGSVFSHLSTLPARRDLAGCCHASHGWLCLLQPMRTFLGRAHACVRQCLDPDAVERAFAVGATDYITKPIHWAVLRHRVRRLIQQSLLSTVRGSKSRIGAASQLVAGYEGTNLQ